MPQHLSLSSLASFASAVGSPCHASPLWAHRQDRAHGQKSKHPELPCRWKKSPVRPGDRWQRRHDSPAAQPAWDSRRCAVSHAPRPVPVFLFAKPRPAWATGEGDRRIAACIADIRSLDGLIPVQLLGKASVVDHAMARVGHYDAQDRAAKRYERNERMPNPEERRAQLWLGELLNEPGMMEALKRYVLRKYPRSSVGEKFKDIRQMALLDAWRRIDRAIARGGEVQFGNEEGLDDLDLQGPRDVDRVFGKAMRENDKDAFKRMAKTLIFNQIGYKGADLTRKETQETIQTVPLDPATVGNTSPRRNENLAPNDYSEPDKLSGRKVDPKIDPDLSNPDTAEDVTERENNQIEGERLKQSWLNWLQNIHDRTTDANHKRRLKACIEFEKLAFVDDGEVRINNGIRGPEDDDPYLYHAILGRTHGARQELAEKHGISISYFEKELRLMRKKYWPAWVASVREEMQ